MTEPKKIKYDFYAENPKRCKVKERFIEGAKLGSVTCQMCGHHIWSKRDEWLFCDVNAGIEDAPQAVKDMKFTEKYSLSLEISKLNKDE